MFKFKTLCMSAMLAAAVEAFAMDHSSRFLYRPDPANPNSNAFVHQNPLACGVGNLPACRANEYAARVNTLNMPMPAGPASRSTLMFRTSTEWRQISLVNGDTGHPLTADIRLVGVSGYFDMSPGLTELFPEANGDLEVARDLLFGHAGGWSSPPSPCVGRYPFFDGEDQQQRFSISTSSTPCMLPLTKNLSSFGMNTRVIHELKLPRPQMAQVGSYTGTVIYTTGPGMDIDFGDSVVTDGTELRIHLRLDVEALFQVEFPGGSTLLSLEPEGGWLNWINRGRKPTRLWREQNFNLSTSIPFKVSMSCEHTEGDQCAIATDDGHQVPVEVRMTLPNGMQDEVGLPVRRYSLNTVDTPHFTPNQFIRGRQGTLHFEVPREEMESMLDHPGKAYNGSVTLVWDPQI